MKALLWAILLCAAAPLWAFEPKRCINLGAALEAPSEGDWGYIITRPHIREIAAAGFDAVRLPVQFSAHLTADGISKPLLSRVDEVIEWAHGAGLTVILDVHHFWELLEAPNPRNKAQLVAIWAQLARHYAHHGDELVFELLNEPSYELSTADAVALYQQIMPDIRGISPDRWVIIGGGQWNSIEEMAGLPPRGSRDVYTFHYYAPWTFTHQNAAFIENPPPARGWGNSTDIGTAQRDFAMAAEFGGPLFLGEFGVYDAASVPDKLAWVRTIRQLAEDHDIGWCYWAFSQGDGEGFQAYYVNQGGWQPGLLDALFD